MNNEETQATPHAIDTHNGDVSDYLIRDIQEATIDLRSRLRIGEPNVTVPTGILERVLDGVETLTKAQATQEKRSVASLYFGTLLGLLIGVVGNFFVSFWFQPLNIWNLLGLIVSGILLLLTSVALFFQVKKFSTRAIEKSEKHPSFSKKHVALTLLMIGLVASGILNSYFYLRITQLEHERAILDSQLLNLESKISTVSEINDLYALLRMPDGLDQHYEIIRNELLEGFAIKGSRGRLLFYVMQVLHDIGDYNGTYSCESFLETHNLSCSSLTGAFLESLCKFKVQENESRNKIRSVYDWLNYYLYYVEDELGFPRFPVETLVLGYGDCEDQAIVVSSILEILGFETALSIISDEEYDLYHCFCLVKNSADIDYPGTLLRSDDYPELGQIWFVLDPTYNQIFGEDPSWMNNYQENGEVNIPSSLWNSIVVDVEEFDRTRQELGIFY